MLSILVGHSYFLRFDRKQWDRAKPYPPLATLQTAAALRTAGHQVAVFDAMLADDTDQFVRQLRSIAPEVVVLYEDNFNFLSKMCLDKMRGAACRMISASRRQGARVVVAGSDATDAAHVYLAAGAEIVLLGEGLNTLSAICERLALQPQLATAELVAGLSELVFKRDGALIRAPGPTARTHAAHPEMPALDLIDVERYRTVWRRAHGYFSQNMSASRGCSFRCNWCSKPIWGNQYLQRNAAAVATEMTHLKRLFQPDHIWFADDIFGFRVSWVSEFARALAASGGSIPFTIQTRADLISERMAAALREAGCQEAWLGAESGSQRVLDAMNKGIRVAEIHTARARLGAAGIRVGFFIQLGYLGEELPDILATRELIETARPDDVGVSVAYPLPGTKFHDLVSAQLGAKTRWQASGELAMMFRGTYSSPFYREIRDLIHEEVRISGRLEAHPNLVPIRARRFLQRRWDHLLARQESFLNARPGTVAAAARRQPPSLESRRGRG